MKVKVERFVNAKGFKEYAIKTKRHMFAKWEYVRNAKGHNALFSIEPAKVAVAEFGIEDITEVLD